MSMRKIREVLRLTHELGLSVREVREATGVGKTAVSEYVNRARVIGITWPIAPEITDAELERRLLTPAGFHEGSTKRLPDWSKVQATCRLALMAVSPASARQCGRGPWPCRLQGPLYRDPAQPLGGLRFPVLTPASTGDTPRHRSASRSRSQRGSIRRETQSRSR